MLGQHIWITFVSLFVGSSQLQFQLLIFPLMSAHLPISPPSAFQVPPSARENDAHAGAEVP